MAIRRRNQGRRRLAKLALVVGTAVAGAVAVIRTRGRSKPDEGADTISPPAPPTPAPVAEEPAIGAAADAAERPAPVRSATAAPPEEGEALATAGDEPPGDAAVTDDSAGDPLVEEEVAKAAAQAGSIGGNAQEMADAEPGFPQDPQNRPVVEGSGDAEETFEQTDTELGGNREHRP